MICVRVVVDRWRVAQGPGGRGFARRRRERGGGVGRETLTTKRPRERRSVETCPPAAAARTIWTLCNQSQSSSSESRSVSFPVHRANHLVSYRIIIVIGVDPIGAVAPILWGGGGSGVNAGKNQGVSPFLPSLSPFFS